LGSPGEIRPEDRFSNFTPFGPSVCPQNFILLPVVLFVYSLTPFLNYQQRSSLWRGCYLHEGLVMETGAKVVDVVSWKDILSTREKKRKFIKMGLDKHTLPGVNFVT